MRELRPLAEQTQPGAIVLTWADVEDEDAAARLVLPVDDRLRELVAAAPEAAGDEPAPAEDPAPARPALRAAADPGDAAAEPAEPAAPAAPKYVMAPREIQDRVRAGSSVAELMEETGMSFRRIDAFAHPVLNDRARIAEQGRLSHPRRSDGPAELTLEEILATAFAARGLDLAEATWDARRDRTGQWIVSLTWTTGMSEAVAEWSWHEESPGHGTTVSRNSLAAELVDPEQHRPRRGLSAVADGARAPAPVDAGAEPAAEEPDEEEEFLRHPDGEAPPRRRRKTVMPSWEDVLLGVRPTDRK
ncbi:septation protein SepH [Corynebacterium sphenisci]|uniref:septation protein SepH n=1 Tax=Corynebacterium sphenisci TaxID=191493 RepID=UPI0026DFF287|nr:septation protein SepH [Corynebacterium sphenisci]MDO5731402.1 septation protein SepH [Corynebacterium sphenisci]